MRAAGEHEKLMGKLRGKLERNGGGGAAREEAVEER
jgi:hypothetical protein